MIKNTIRFHEGEKRELTATVTSRNCQETVVIVSATFELIKVFNNTVVQTGTCEIIGNKINIFLDLVKSGSYELKTTLLVGKETIIDKINIEVD